MITVTEYLQGRDKLYPLEFSPTIMANAVRTVELANKVLVLAKGAGVPIKPRADGTMTNSGWRPPSLNAKTPGASRTSLHMSGEAIDLNDPAGDLDAWFARVAPTVLTDLGLWLEHPSATPEWSHLQTKPPPSRARIFHP